ncbi:MAG: hypothetical protein Q8761_02930 [Sweet potato little leaf phytoplasma]|nr:hypothetical protein [Sweet potato little leaf phytoplasma]
MEKNKKGKIMLALHHLNTQIKGRKLCMHTYITWVTHHRPTKGQEILHVPTPHHTPKTNHADPASSWSKEGRRTQQVEATWGGDLKPKKIDQSFISEHREGNFDLGF